MAGNPLITDREMTFALYEVHDALALTALPAFGDHDRDTFEMYLDSCARLARGPLLEAYKPMDEAPPELHAGRIAVHPMMKAVYPRLVDLGTVAATRPYEVGGQQMPSTVATAAVMMLMAGNLSAAGYVFLTTGAAHLIESFGSPALREQFMRPMYAGRWTGTMALTEPHAGSSLSDVTTTAHPIGGERYRIRGSKIFISGGEHDLTENIVHMTLARIPGGPPGTRGVSLFAVPKRRMDGGRLVPNDVAASQAIHKIGWRGLPSVVLDYGDADDCVGWLVGEPHHGLKYMFQMMNEARIMVGASGVATASVAYHEALAYAAERPQGRPLGERDPTTPQVPIVAHADVRRMLLRQKAIVEGGLSLVLETARAQDLAEHAADPETRKGAQALLDLLTPIAKTFPAEWGFEANALAVQIHGGYGYSSEYRVEAWLRDQKLNSIHEGTTGIHGLDLLGRKVLGDGGQALRRLGAELAAAARDAADAGVAPEFGETLLAAFSRLGAVSITLGQLGAQGGTAAMMRHSTDYLLAASAIVVSWQWLKMATAATAGLSAGARGRDRDFYEGKRCAAEYWLTSELPLANTRLDLIERGNDAFDRVRPEWL